MLVLPGCSALTATKRKEALSKIRGVCADVQSVDAVYVHLVKCQSIDAETILNTETSEQRHILDTLLDYGDDNSFPATRKTIAQSAGGSLVYVLPRPGSISPWSSKATDIARLCKLAPYVERIERGTAYVFTLSSPNGKLSEAQLATLAPVIHDRMTQSVSFQLPLEDELFQHHEPKSLRTIDIQRSPEHAKETLSKANMDLGLALAQDEIQYLVQAYVTGEHPLKRNPTDAELFMFAQVNSEHCRHKIFNASWTIDGDTREKSLFQMIRNTESLNGQYTISAYSDNAAVFEGFKAPRFAADIDNPVRVYSSREEDIHILVKVETHNHPTAVSPYPGAATGSGGEIRDEGAVGRGSKPKAGLSGFAVSNLLIPGFEQPWEEDFGRPSHIASALDIMIDGPLGASAFNNEFGRPALAGYFRTFCERVPSSVKLSETEVRGYHKPIMIAGGVGNVRPQFVKKTRIDAGAKIAVLGGPGMLIGLGGGAASSQTSGASSADLDFASVQRDNAEMQRRCQQVIDSCVHLGDRNPIQSIHDVGAGGLSNALPELVHDSGLGARFEIRDVLVADTSMSPMEIWCNESQERYVMAISPSESARFEGICARERCPFSFVGVATEEQSLIVTDRLLKNEVINLSMTTLFGKPPRMTRNDLTPSINAIPFDNTLGRYLSPVPTLEERVSIAIRRVLRLPSVGSKSFLITIGDRSITGLVTRDQMVGPWQVPVADVAVTRTSYGFDVVSGEAMAMGERPTVALLSAGASARLAVGEAVTNLVAASIESIERVKLSANWMCAASKPGEGARLYEAVRAIGMELCPALGIGIPVGKDSMSMSMKWKQDDTSAEVSAPLSLNITAFAPVQDVRQTWSPQLRTDITDTVLVLVDLSNGRERLGGSAIAQVFKEIGSEPPDVDHPDALKAFFNVCQRIRSEFPDLVLAYHDRSDGGVFTTAVEMCFAGRVGAEIDLDELTLSKDPVAALFNEELGAVLQVRRSDFVRLLSILEKAHTSISAYVLGSVNKAGDQTIKILHGGSILFSGSRSELQQTWAETSYRMQCIRDDPVGAKQEFDAILDGQHTGLFYDLTFSYEPPRVYPSRPKVAILREQGVNGHVEMAWAFTAAGFDAVDVHMSDIINGFVTLADFRGVAACGGFSYGDVLGAGNGWANSILLNDHARSEFETFFRRQDAFGLAVCNGCQFFSHLREIIPSAKSWPEFKANRSERFEARVSMVEITSNSVTSSSVFLRDMVGSKLPVAVAHGEGRASFANEAAMTTLLQQGLVGVRYVDSQGKPTEVYPFNPNGSPEGITGVQTNDGRILALMPHPERVTTLHSNSWYPPSMLHWGNTGPWFRMFQSARAWCG